MKNDTIFVIYDDNNSKHKIKSFFFTYKEAFDNLPHYSYAIGEFEAGKLIDFINDDKQTSTF